MSIAIPSSDACSGPIFRGNRKEITNVTLNILEGHLPDNLYGHIYFLSQCGNPNSGGIPFPKKLPDGSDNPDFGSPILNGDGMVFRIDFPGNATAQATCRLMKTPSYYADDALSFNGEATKSGDYKEFAFKNYGIIRMSLLLGPKNTLNTALIPVNFKDDSGISILATNDVSRPWKIDPVTMEMISPIGKNEEWVSGFPPLMQTPFPMFETTAHPSYDPQTRELYITNYTKSSETEMSKSNLKTMMHMHEDKLIAKLEDIAKRHDNHGDDDKARRELKELLNSANPIHEKQAKKNQSIWQKILGFLKGVFKWVGKEIGKGMETEDQVFIYTFDGSGEMKQNRLVDEDGNNLVIIQCMHQTSISDNWIILMDSSFKFSFDLLINNPFPNHEFIDRFIRIILSKQVLQNTQVWIVNRQDLRDASPGSEVLAREIPGGVPSECVHFTAEFDDSNDEVTFYTAQNTASCLAEWVRTYDINHFTKQPPTEGFIGDYAVGELSVNSVGKYVIDTKTATMKEKIELEEMGNLPPVEDLDHKPIKDIGPNTWGIGLYALRDFISPEVKTNKISNIFYVNFGANPKLLTEYIYQLYKNAPGLDPKEVDKVLAYTEKGVPASVINVNTSTMQIDDHFEFDKKQGPISIQFTPSKVSTPGRDPGIDGYIFMTVKQCIGKQYQSQLWIFEAWNLNQGPICKLGSPQLQYCASIHSMWLPEIKSVTSPYSINIEEDFNYTIDKSTLFFEDSHYHEFFNKYIYPNFKN